MLSDDVIDPVYEAAVQATEEAIINAMLAARTMTGANWYRVEALPHEGVREVLARHGGWWGSEVHGGVGWRHPEPERSEGAREESPASLG